MDQRSGRLAMVYAREMKGRFGYDVLFPPNSKVELGDYGTISEEGWWYQSATPSPFSRVGNIRRSFQIEFDTIQSETIAEDCVSEHVSIQYCSASASGGTAPIGADGQVEITFGREEEVLYHGTEMTLLEIDDIGQLGTDLLRLQRWDPRWAVVTKVHKTTGIVVLVSSQKNAIVKLGGNATLTTDGNLASANVLVTQHSAGVSRYIRPNGTFTPIVQVHQLRKKTERKPTKQAGKVECSGLGRANVTSLANFASSASAAASANVAVSQPGITGAGMGTTRTDETDRRMWDDEWKLEIVSLWPGLLEEQDASDNQDEKQRVADGAAIVEDDGAAPGHLDKKPRAADGGAHPQHHRNVVTLDIIDPSQGSKREGRN